MSSPAVLALETARYGSLSEELRARFADLDEETLQDTLEGLSELPELLKAIMRSSLLDEAFAFGLKGRLSEMKEWLDRWVERSSRKRELVCESMVRSTEMSSGADETHTASDAAPRDEGTRPELSLCDR
jgi:hypothetical protein